MSIVKHQVRWDAGNRGTGEEFDEACFKVVPGYYPGRTKENHRELHSETLVIWSKFDVGIRPLLNVTVAA
jgi:hypothetical protein